MQNPPVVLVLLLAFLSAWRLERGDDDGSPLPVMQPKCTAMREGHERSSRRATKSSVISSHVASTPTKSIPSRGTRRWRRLLSSIFRKRVSSFDEIAARVRKFARPHASAKLITSFDIRANSCLTTRSQLFAKYISDKGTNITSL